MRNNFREANENAETLVSGSDSFDQSLSSNFYDVMKTISLNCSNAIGKFAGRIIKESVDVLSVVLMLSQSAQLLVEKQRHIQI